MGTGPTGYSSSVSPEAELSASPENLALSVSFNGSSALTGHTRTITITNHSATQITNLSVSTPTPAFPPGTSSTNTCDGATLSAGGSCTISITPGNAVTSGAGALPCDTNGIAPTPSVMTITGNGGVTTTANIVVLGYGCQYQGGYIYSIDDTTPETSSIGGKVVTSSDQSDNIVWSTTLDSIWGINNASTIASPSPNTTSTPASQLTTYQLNCDATNDGSCATNNIIIYYEIATNYAAGLCKQALDNTGSICTGGSNCYTDWYLPSVCDLGPFGSGDNYLSPPGSQQCASGSTNIQNELVSTGIVSNLNDSNGYWSSTEYFYPSLDESYFSWYQIFDPVFGQSNQSNDQKNTTGYGARCVRALTP